ncbi:FkbM family methyltransferase [Gluconacetobacter sp. Hr-1-5]|uniref:FkbM family methyltransferase n=1 Tax=Gluconacetobacter sp. Hr-1-5 TaxID=3395370 RepID=UPI003B5155DE
MSSIGIDSFFSFLSSERYRSPSEHESLFIRQCLINYNISKAQLFQDIFALHVLGWRRSGFFVEFGATNGEDLSNTYLLERNFEWKGILSEPNPVWHRDLNKSRQCIIDHRCVWSESGSNIMFSYNDVDAEFATAEIFQLSDMHARIRKDFKLMEVETVSLNDLLYQNHAPSIIDYLSIDTEGSELEILKEFDFKKYHVNVVTVEHNFNAIARENIFRLMNANGFTRQFENLSQWDDWYVNSHIS